MPLVPLSKKVVGSIVEKVTTQSSILWTPDATNRKPKLAMKVEYVGPKCNEVVVGDTVILPEGGWVIVSLIEDGEDEPVQKISIPEDLILAKVV